LANSNQLQGVPVTVNGTGRLDLNNNSDSVGALTLNGGTVTTGTGTLTLGGDVTAATVTVNGSPVNPSISGNITLPATRTFTVTGALVVPAVVGGIGGLTKAGGGTLALSGTNTYSGPTTVNAGALNIS